MIPQDLKYTKEHEWIRVEGDTGTIGITDYAQHELGDIVFVELPQVGAKVEFMKAFGTIEAVKAVSDIFSPLTGEIVDVNTALETNASAINTDPYGQGWIIKVKMTNPSELNNLLDAAAYGKLIGQ
ncbi:MAG: glycine cleavage system protein GcvH [candidate division Zixibacteria bacterium]|nr:glycine cleavage system protein GcvH [candidate division Zixibacteria bacterium]